MAPKATDLMTAKSVRRTRRLDGPMLGEIERECFSHLDEKLSELRHLERAQVALLGEILGQRPQEHQVTGTIRHLHSVQ